MLICPPFQFPAIFVCTFCMLSAYQTIHTGEYKFVRSVVAAPNLADTLCSGMGNVLFCVLRVHILECATAHFYSKESLRWTLWLLGDTAPVPTTLLPIFRLGWHLSGLLLLLRSRAEEVATSIPAFEGQAVVIFSIAWCIFGPCTGPYLIELWRSCLTSALAGATIFLF